jgi:hypothetical protein
MTSWRPYVVAQGDTTSSLAARHGIARDAILGHEHNATLFEKRKNPDILLAGDIVHLPEDPPRNWLPVKLGKANRFQATLHEITLRIALPAYASSPYSASAEGVTLTGTADANGRIELRVPAHVPLVRVQFSAPAGVVHLHVGHLDPIDSRSGLRQRLTNLGIPVGDEDGDHALRRALAIFQSRHDLDPTGVLDADTRTRLEEKHGQ